MNDTNAPRSITEPHISPSELNVGLERKHKIPAILFDGHEVFKNLSDKARARTSSENVSDVLDAVVKIMRSNLK